LVGRGDRAGLFAVSVEEPDDADGDGDEVVIELATREGPGGAQSDGAPARAASAPASAAAVAAPIAPQRSLWETDLLYKLDRPAGLAEALDRALVAGRALGGVITVNRDQVLASIGQVDDALQASQLLTMAHSRRHKCLQSAGTSLIIFLASIFACAAFMAGTIVLGSRERAGVFVLIAGQVTFVGVILATALLRIESRLAMSAYVKGMSVEVEGCITRLNAQLAPQGVRLRQYRPMGIGSPHQALRLEFVAPTLPGSVEPRFPAFSTVSELPRSTTARIASQLANIRDPPAVVRAALVSHARWWNNLPCCRSRRGACTGVYGLHEQLSNLVAGGSPAAAVDGADLDPALTTKAQQLNEALFVLQHAVAGHVTFPVTWILALLALAAGSLGMAVYGGSNREGPSGIRLYATGFVAIALTGVIMMLAISFRTSRRSRTLGASLALLLADAEASAITATRQRLAVVTTTAAGPGNNDSNAGTRRRDVDPTSPAYQSISLSWWAVLVAPGGYPLHGVGSWPWGVMRMIDPAW